MSNGDDVLDNWEELDEAGLCMTLQTKLQTASDDTSSKLKPATTVETTTGSKMKLLQRPQSLQESSAAAAAPKQIMIAKKPAASVTDADLTAAPVMMVLHKSASEYDAANYANPINNQTVKILRRPAQAEERRDSNGIRPKQPIKTLQQREQEYAQARLRILGSAKNPEDDKPAAAPTPVSNASTTPVNPSAQWQAEAPSYAANFNNNNNNNSGGGGGGAGIVPSTAPGMHRSSSAPKMSQPATPMYNYNNYYQAPPPPHTAAAMSYIYSAAPLFQHQRMPPYVTGPAASAAPTPNPQQSWSPVVGGSVSAALLRQQSMHSPQQQQAQQTAAQPQYAHPYNDNVLRLPRGPCPNGTIGFQMRR
ncbi:hypothetical protein ACLKA6_017682 [Drosophila palustris]